MNFSDPMLMLRCTVALAALSSFVMAVELLYVAMRCRQGVFWRCCQSSLAEMATLAPPIRWACPGVIHFMPVALGVYALSAAVTLVLTLSGGRYQEALFVLTATSLLVAYWRVVGGDGASQMTLIVLSACSLAVLAGEAGGGPTSALWFVGLQALLAYAVAGWAKVVSPQWRNEDVVSKIASTVCYGNGQSARVMDAVPGLGRALTLSVIVFEVSMPISIFLPVEATMVFLAIALLFHAGCAVVMGLNDFVWAFASTFPGILFVSHAMNEVMRQGT